MLHVDPEKMMRLAKVKAGGDEGDGGSGVNMRAGTAEPETAGTRGGKCSGDGGVHGVSAKPLLSGPSANGGARSTADSDAAAADGSDAGGGGRGAFRAMAAGHTPYPGKGRGGVAAAEADDGSNDGDNDMDDGAHVPGDGAEAEAAGGSEPLAPASVGGSAGTHAAATGEAAAGERCACAFTPSASWLPLASTFLLACTSCSYFPCAAPFLLVLPFLLVCSS